jgi:hypothetical protein
LFVGASVECGWFHVGIEEEHGRCWVGLVGSVVVVVVVVEG